jgi:uncharacterized protein (TIGR02996 family)
VTEQALLAAVAEAPGDPVRRQVLADWLEEHGRTGAARAQRWLAQGNAPWCDETETWTWFAHSDQVLAFWRERGFTLEGMLPEHPPLDLPASARGGNDYQGISIVWWDFSSREEAEQALMESWPDGG